VIILLLWYLCSEANNMFEMDANNVIFDDIGNFIV